MANNWIAGATKNKGGLHRALGVPMGQPIPLRDVMAAAKKPGKVGKEARLALTLRGLTSSSSGSKSAPAKKTATSTKGPKFGSPEWRAKYMKKGKSSKKKTGRVASLIKQERALEKSGKKTAKEKGLEKKISKLTGKKYEGKR